jgi:hypothetical protein
MAAGVRVEEGGPLFVGEDQGLARLSQFANHGLS